MRKEKVLTAIQASGLIEKNQHIVIGVSGGPDSVCLFHALLSMREEMGLNLYPVHINHKFRPGAAERDQEYVEQLCRENGCSCRTYAVDCGRLAEEKKITSEEAGRLVRYKAFAQVAAELKKKGIPAETIRIAVAQNADDQAETILFRILRGVGTDGLSGIKPQRTDSEGNRIIRPLLQVHREEIEAYCREQGLTPCIDGTNLQPLYTRNRIRLQLIPYLEREYNPKIKDTIIRMGRNAEIDGDFLRQEAEKAFRRIKKEETGGSVLLDGPELQKLHRAVRQRVLLMAFRRIGLEEDISAAHLEGCETIVFQKNPSARADLPKGYYLTKVYEDVKAAGETGEDSRTYKMSVLSLEDYCSRAEKRGQTAAFDYDKLQAVYGKDFEKNICMRTRRPGDYIAFSEKHRKKIQDCFVDAKVPRDEREKIFLLAAGREILWIVFPRTKGRYSARYKLCQDTKKVFFVEMVRRTE